MKREAIIKTIKARLKETGKSLTDNEIKSMADKIEKAGTNKMALVGETALNAESHDVDYSASQHLNVLTGMK